MKTIKTIFKAGMGPSSSHTMGPYLAASKFAAQYSNAVLYKVILYGSLAATGRGHLTDKAIMSAFAPKQVEILWQPSIFHSFHPNSMDLQALDREGNIIVQNRAYSVGGGEILFEGEQSSKEDNIYPHKNFEEIKNFCKENDLLLFEYVENYEGSEIWEFLSGVYASMLKAIERGLQNDGRLPGKLNLPRKARYFSRKSNSTPSPVKEIVRLYSYALACSEENASGGIVVTAPTCGAAGVLPAVLRNYAVSDSTVKERDILRALATAGLIGNIVRTNASISGAEVGCQGEIGVACSMAAAALSQLIDPAAISCIEYSAELAIEHHLGLTCDPVEGLVQIPCIERNALAAMRAYECATFAVISGGRHRVSFDQVVKVMNETGRDLQAGYRETALGGLAAELSETNEKKYDSVKWDQMQLEQMQVEQMQLEQMQLEQLKVEQMQLEKMQLEQMLNASAANEKG